VQNIGVSESHRLDTKQKVGIARIYLGLAPQIQLQYLECPAYTFFNTFKKRRKEAVLYDYSKNVYFCKGDSYQMQI